jgi:hypothetical protein
MLLETLSVKKGSREGTVEVKAKPSCHSVSVRTVNSTYEPEDCDFITGFI